MIKENYNSYRNFNEENRVHSLLYLKMDSQKEVEGHQYKMREMYNDGGGYGPSRWTEAFVDGQWVKHGLHVDTLYHQGSRYNMYVDITETLYEKGPMPGYG